MLSLADVRAAAGRLDGIAHRTPVLHSRRLDSELGAEVYLKAECFQRTGSFKFRGAFNAVAALDPAERARGVVTASSGNHAAALALAASMHGVPAVIVMPQDAPANKRAATVGYGGEIVAYDRYREDREAIAAAIAAERGLTLVPPYDHWDVMAGQGTLALELFDDVGALDALLVPVGGGGLIAGCATVAAGVCPNTRVIGVEPAAGDDTRRSLVAGRREALAEVPQSIADGQLVVAPGRLTFEVNRGLLDSVVTVSDEAILEAMAALFEVLKVVAEPSGASALAALTSGTSGSAGGRIGVALSGGNIDVERFAKLMAGRAP